MELFSIRIQRTFQLVSTFQDYNRNEKRTYEALVTGVFCGIFNFSKKRHKKICKLQKP